MRPRGFPYEKAALDEGMHGIVMPSREAVQYGAKLGLDVIEKESCCAVE